MKVYLRYFGLVMIAVIIPLIFVMFVEDSSYPEKREEVFTERLVDTQTESKLLNTSETISVKDFGAVGDGVSDDYQALKSAFNYVNQKGGNVTLVFPKGTYFIERVYKAKNFGVKLTDSSEPWEGSKNEEITHLFIKDASNFNIIGNGSTIKVKGDYHKTIDADLWGEKYTFKYPVMPFVFLNCSNFTMSGFDINGSGDQTTRESNSIAEAYGYGLLLQDSSNFVIKDILTHNWVTDGLIVGHLGWVTNGEFINIVSEHNARQAISIDLAKNLVFRNSRFSYAGQLEGGTYGSHSLGAGLNIEPEGGATLENPTENIFFEDSEFSHNIGAEIFATWEVAKEIYFKRCKVIRSVSKIGEGILLGTNSTYFEDTMFDFHKKVGVILTNFSDTYSSSKFIRSHFIDARIMSDLPEQPLVIEESIIEFLGKDQDDIPIIYIENNQAILKNNRIFIGKDYYNCFNQPCQRLYYGQGKFDSNVYETDKSGVGYFFSFYGKRAIIKNEVYPSSQFQKVKEQSN
ncbi:MAG: glycosyl hydrolase family 28-related protein [Neobacillus sp.]